MTISKWTTKPIVVRAMRWTGNNTLDAMHIARDAGAALQLSTGADPNQRCTYLAVRIEFTTNPPRLSVASHSGGGDWQVVDVGDWVVLHCGPPAKLRVVGDGAFSATYQLERDYDDDEDDEEEP